MTKEPSDAAVPAAVNSHPPDDTMPRETGPFRALGNPADLDLPYGDDHETAPVSAPPPINGGRPVTTGSPPRPVRVGRGTGKLSKGFIATYFAGGLVLLLVGAVAVVYLAVRAYSGNVSEQASVTVSRGGQPSPSLKVPPVAKPSVSAPSLLDPSDPARARFGPQRLANGKPFVVTGENNSKFQVTVTAGKFHKGACDSYSVKPEEGGYLPVKLKVKVLEGEPEISEYDFRFQKPDGSWLPSVGGSGCDGRDYGGFLRRLSAGREYSSSVVFDVPNRKGDIVFVYPIMDVVAAWKVG